MNHDIHPGCFDLNTGEGMYVMAAVCELDSTG
jgi:hypothetical protein